MKGKWIYYPGDFEVYMLGKMGSRRIERDIMISPFWRVDNYFSNIKFIKKVNLEKQEVLHLQVEGIYNVLLDGVYLYGDISEFCVDKGEHNIEILVYNDKALPCLCVNGETIFSGDTWQVTCNDHHVYRVGVFDEDNLSPNTYKLKTKRVDPISKIKYLDGYIYDFGIELMGYINIKEPTLKNINLYYGESIEEAKDFNCCEVMDKITIDSNYFESQSTRAFRYVFCQGDCAEFYCNYEYNDIAVKGSFLSSDKLLQDIYKTAVHTQTLTTRELFIDGIKRDRWTWGGDASQSYLISYFLHFEPKIVKRTMLSLLSKSPIKTFTNHIMDYSFYWIISLKEYVDFVSDIDFIKDIYERVEELIEFCFTRVESDGFIYGKEYDWLFIDWADIEKNGALCAEQMLFLKALKCFDELSQLIGKDVKDYIKAEIKLLEQKIPLTFWSEKNNCFRWSSVDDDSSKITRYPNIFAIIYNLVNDKTKGIIAKNVLLKEEIQQITTPYMKFYEMQALCITNHQDIVINEIKSFWGGMLELGATTFWETFEKDIAIPEQYAMYGRKYGKSLCHSWGSSPIYIFGRYIVGYNPINGQKVLQPYEIGKFKGVVPVGINEKITVEFADELIVETDVEVYFNTKNIFNYEAGENRILIPGKYKFERKKHE